MPKQPPLRREDGAKFYVNLKRQRDGTFRACYRVQTNYPTAMIEPVEKVLPSEHEAWHWVQTQAAARGFYAVFVEHEQP